MPDGRPRADDVQAGQRVYTPPTLRVYDLFVLGFSNRLVWRCPSARMLERYESHVGARHLDVGVGTGWVSGKCRWPVDRPQITLLDLNENSLSVASNRVRRYAPATVQANVFDPVDLGDARFDSIGANYLFHCLPGRLEEKAATVVSNLRPYAEAGGRALRQHDSRPRRLPQPAWTPSDEPLQPQTDLLEPRGRPAGTRERACLRADRGRDRGRRRCGALRRASVPRSGHAVARSSYRRQRSARANSSRTLSAEYGCTPETSSSACRPLSIAPITNFT